MWAQLIQQGAQNTLKAGSTLLEGKFQDDVAEANARIAEQRAESKALAITSEREKLAKNQRGVKADQRMTVASRGGLMGGTDLLTLAEESKNMQMDQLEMVRQRDVALIEGKNQANMIRWKKDVNKKGRKWTALAQLHGG
jgi:hypothetical protein